MPCKVIGYSPWRRWNRDTKLTITADHRLPRMFAWATWPIMERTEKGTYNIVLIGLWRAHIEEEILPVRSFRRAKVQLLDEKPADTPAEVTRQLGRDLAERLVADVPAAQKLASEFTEGNISLGALTDIIAFHLPFDLKFKLGLLSETDVLQRARLLLSNLPQQPRPESQQQEYRPGFSEN
jgi:Lon protease-like protein